jgi:hypothetical protein
MTRSFAQQACTGVAALALAAAGTALPSANAAPLIFDCYSRSTSDLLMKSALDLSNDNLACIQTAAAPVAVVQPVAVAPAPAAPTGESFLGSVIGGALGGLIGNAINGDHTTEIHHHHHAEQQQEAPKAAPNRQNLKLNLEQLNAGSRPNLMKGGLALVKQQQEQQSKVNAGMMQLTKIQQAQAYGTKKQQSEAKANTADPFRQFRIR